MIIIELFSRQEPVMRIFRLGASNQRKKRLVKQKMQTYRILQDLCGFTGTNVCFWYLPCFNFKFC